VVVPVSTGLSVSILLSLFVVSCGDSLLWFMSPVVPDFWFSCSFGPLALVLETHSCCLCRYRPDFQFSCSCRFSLLLFAVFRNRADSHVLIQFTPALRVRPLVTPADIPQISFKVRIFVGSLLRIIVPQLRILLRWDSSPIYRSYAPVLTSVVVKPVGSISCICC
jgi:hypothetical protein